MNQVSILQLFNDLYAKNYPKFVRFAYNYVRDMSIAEDFTTEAFMAYWSNRDTLAQDINPRAYILTAIKNKSLNHLRNVELRENILKKISEQAKWEIDMRISTLEACDPNEMFSTELQKLVDEALAKMPAKTMEIFILSRYQDKTHKEIAEIMGMSTKGVEFHISKALKILRKELKDYLGSFLLLLFLHLN